MQLYSYAPGKVTAPALWVLNTWVKELGVTWNDLGGIDLDEIALLAEMTNIWQEARALIERVQSRSKH